MLQIVPSIVKYLTLKMYWLDIMILILKSKYDRCCKLSQVTSRVLMASRIYLSKLMICVLLRIYWNHLIR
jgi:hypothetical protein